MGKIIYMDNAATTSMYRRAVEEMMPYMTTWFYNPSGAYMAADEIKSKIEQARERVAMVIGALPEEIYFTSGGTEADNWAINSMLDNGKDNHIITSKIEHHAILNSCESASKKGVRVTYVNVNRDGVVNTKEIENAITDNTRLISVMAANNEIGTTEPIAQIGKIARKNNVIFHTDAVQAYTHMYLNVNSMNIDMMSISAHKFGGPKGVGALYIRKGINASSFMNGGMQEHGMRAGTYNVAGIVGMGSAAYESYKNMNRSNLYVKKIRDYVIDEIMYTIDKCKINGDVYNRLPGNLNICIKGVSGKKLVKMLGERGICVSTGSVCNSVSLKPSHVLKAIGMSDADALSSIRISLSSEIKKEDVDYFIKNFADLVQLLRNKNL